MLLKYFNYLKKTIEEVKNMFSLVYFGTECLFKKYCVVLNNVLFVLRKLITSMIFFRGN